MSDYIYTMLKLLLPQILILYWPLQEIRPQRDRRADVHPADHVLHHQEAPQRDGHLQQEADQRGRGDQGGGPGSRGQVRQDLRGGLQEGGRGDPGLYYIENGLRYQKPNKS